VELTGLKSVMTEKQLIFTARMDPMNIEARYPDYKENIRKLLGKKETEEILMDTGKLVKWLKAKLS
jgi:HEPN domain-containing protein